MIVGAPRSGTTLTQQLMANHSQIYTIPETHYFDFMFRRDIRKYLDYFWIPKSRYTSFLEYARKYELFNILEDVESISNARQAVTYFINTMDVNAAHLDCNSWIEKTPAHLMHIYKIEKYYKDLLFIHVVRKPEDIVASLVKLGRTPDKKWEKYGSIEISIDTVNMYFNKMKYYFNKNNHKYVFYEKLIKKPEETVSYLLDQSGIGHSGEQVDEMLTNLDSVDVIREDESWKRGYGDHIISGRKSKFTTIFSGVEQEYIRASLVDANSIYSNISKCILN